MRVLRARLRAWWEDVADYMTGTPRSSHDDVVSAVEVSPVDGLSESEFRAASARIMRRVASGWRVYGEPGRMEWYHPGDGMIGSRSPRPAPAPLSWEERVVWEAGAWPVVASKGLFDDDVRC